MSPTGGMYHFRPADLIVGRVSVSLQNAFELSKKLLWAIASPTETEVKHHGSSWPTVLPEVCWVVLSEPLVCLHINRGFIGLYVSSANQLPPHGGDHRNQQLAHFEDPAVQRRAADFQTDVPFQNHALPIQRQVIAILADDRVDDDPVAGHALLDNPWGQRCRDHSKFFTRPASPFLSFRDQHEVLRRFHIQLGTLLVADHHGFFAAALAHALIRRARKNPLYARKIRRQLAAPWMFTGCLCRAPGGRLLTLRLLDHFTDYGLKFEQFHLRVGELFAACSKLLDPHQSQTLF